MKSLLDNLLQYGASKSDIVLLNDASSDAAIEYADLLPSARQKAPVPVSAVVKSGGRPLLYVVSGDAPNVDGNQADSLAHILACRGHPSFFGILEPGRLVVYPCKFGTVQAEQIVVREGNSALGFIIDLQNGLLGSSQKQSVSDATHLHNVLSKTLRTVAKEILSRKIFSGAENGPDQVLALVGRALFSRFLLDREIINEQTFPDFFKKYNPETCFQDAEAATAVCEWLDKTFNGELLPLAQADGYRAYFENILSQDAEALSPLHWIMARTDVGGQQTLWQYINFSFVPVGVLSEVYEDFAHAYREEEAREESVHYTPRHIAEPLVEQAFGGIPAEGRHLAKVLDPACGAGIFLVLAYRHLAKEYLRCTGKRADSVTLRKILYDQIRGFDISEDALKLSALSLYLTAIELDPDPLPPHKLMFEKNLIGTVLRNLRSDSGPQYGSLGTLTDEEAHRHTYDIVIGNPPWSEWKRDRKEQEKNANQIANRILKERNPELTEAPAYENPDNVTDLPFVWRSMDFARQDGVIALIVHGRLLFKRTEKGDNARRHIFDNLKISGILNGADFSDDKVMWKIGAPFCILFAWNRKPAESETIQVLSPYLDSSTLFLPRLRLDPSRSKAVSVASIKEEPYILKVLSRGTELDLAIIRKLEARLRDRPTQIARLGDYWGELGLASGDGYKVGNKKNEPKKLRESKGVKLTPKDQPQYFYDASELQDFDIPKLEAERDLRIYQSPIVYFPEAPGEHRLMKRARLAKGSRPIIFCESFIGYSASGVEDADLLSQYLLVLGNSALWMYYMLLTSSKLGVERRAIYKHDIDAFPVHRLSKLTANKPAIAETIFALTNKLKIDERQGLDDIDQFVFDLYSISQSERRTVHDTLQYSIPYSKSQKAARAAPSASELTLFGSELQRVLNERLSVIGQKAQVRIEPPDGTGIKSWGFLNVRLDGEKTVEDSGQSVESITQLADAGAASHIYIKTSPRSLRLGILSQARYWSPSRARLRASDILELLSEENSQKG